ncbi:hypothetical protein SLS60_005708 [Paraconiothyrium brasiliense]|uniref:Uncharacterized protein n=1 Tax=Paraconiothyrium brasiliense TaxID=300254 RepID=A0ABR3RI50_9PLEO
MLEARLLETVYEDDIEETYSMEQMYSNQLHEIAEFDLATLPEEDFIETPAPDPHVIDKLEADVIAMLGIASGDSDDFETFDSDASTRSTSGTSLPTGASSPRDIASKPLPPLPIESLSIDNETTNELPTTGARRQDIDHRPDSAGALVQSPTMLPGSPGRMWDASRNPRTTVRHRPSRITLDPDQLSAIEDLSHSLDFGERPLSLSLCAYTNIWSKPQKESPVKKFLNKVTEGNKKMYEGVKYAGPRSFRTRRRRSGITYIGKAEAERPDTRRFSA